MESDDRCLDDEESDPLLYAVSKTPFPWRQISFVFLGWAAEPISSRYTSPFINQFIGELGITGGDDRKIGYYTGLIDSLFYGTQALTTWRWNQLSDFVGRRPIFLLGLLGLSASNIAFGLSRTLAALVTSRCIGGLLDGNLGVMKSMIGDITDHTNMAQAFALMPVAYSIGATIAPLYGGALVVPQKQWPDIFRGEFWSTYPYFLPSLVSGCFILLIFLVSAVFLKEMLPSNSGITPGPESSATEDPDGAPTGNGLPIPILTLMKTYSIIIPVANYGTLAFMEICFLALLPLFYLSPTKIGGLGFPPSIIGTYLAIYGIVNSAVQALFTPRIIKWIGPKRLFCSAVLWFYPLILIFPIMSAVVTPQGQVGPIIWILLVLQLVCTVLMDMSYTVIFVFTTRAAPNKQSLGAVNGFSQSVTSIVRAIGPVSTTSLFAVSKEYNVLGGNLVYVILVILTTILVVLSRRLPELKDKEY